MTHPTLAVSFFHPQALLFRTRPSVPAIAKWTTCGAACRYFLLTCGYRNLFFTAFNTMHSGGLSADLLADGKLEATEMVPATDLVSDASEQGAYRKVLRIKSFKAFEWLKSERTVYDLLTCTLVNQVLEKIMWTFMAWQRDEACLALETAPLIQMANSKKSPAVRAMVELSNIMKSASLDGLGLDASLQAQPCQNSKYTVFNFGIMTVSCWFAVTLFVATTIINYKLLIIIK